MNIWKDCERVPITNLLKFVVDNRGKTVPTAESGHILIATNCVKNDSLYPKYEKIRYLSQDTYDNFFRAHPIPGDILFVNKGTPGRVCLVPDPIDFCIAQDMIALRANEKLIDNHYLLAVLRSSEIQRHIYNTSVGDVIPHFKKQFLDTIRIPMPPYVYQKKIGDFFFLLSNKIELNNKINAQLEEMAQAIFKNWFVNFEPFKDGKFVESELGMIPEGWRVGTLFDVAEIYDKKRKPLSGNERDKMQKIYPYYGATSCMDYVDDYLFDGIYTLIGEDGSVVKENGLPFMQYVWGKIWVNNHAHILQGKNGFSTEMIHCFLSQTNIKHLVTGAVQAKLSQSNMQKIIIAIPPMNVLNSVRPFFESLYTQYRSKTEESLHLAQLRDTLLPKLMSGEIELGPSIEEQLKIIDEMFAGLQSAEPINVEGEPIASLIKFA